MEGELKKEKKMRARLESQSHGGQFEGKLPWRGFPFQGDRINMAMRNLFTQL